MCIRDSSNTLNPTNKSISTEKSTSKLWSISSREFICQIISTINQRQNSVAEDSQILLQLKIDVANFDHKSTLQYGRSIKQNYPSIITQRQNTVNPPDKIIRYNIDHKSTSKYDRPSISKSIINRGDFDDGFGLPEIRNYRHGQVEVSLEPKFKMLSRMAIK